MGRLIAAGWLALMVGAASAAGPDDYVGDWRGTVIRPGGAAPYSAEFSIQKTGAGELAGTSNYPELRCAGTLKQSAAAPGTVQLTETPAQGQPGCMPAARVALIVFPGGTLQSVWSSADGRMLFGRAQLVRGAPSRPVAPMAAAPSTSNLWPPAQCPRGALAASAALPQVPAGDAAGTSANPALRQRDVLPTLIEPQRDPGLPGRPSEAGWYADTLGDGASLQMGHPFQIPPDGPRLTVRDLHELKRNAPPGLFDVLNLAHMPSLTDVALMSRVVAALVGNDPEAAALLSALEQRGHALARAVGADPAMADFLANEVQRKRELINVRSTRVARGDKVSPGELATLIDCVTRSELGVTAIQATRALVAAQHNLRLKVRLPGKSQEGFFLLRSGSFDGVLSVNSQTGAAQAQVSQAACLLMGMGCDRPSAPPQGLSRPGCFPLEQDGRWAASEVAAHQKSCGPATLQQAAAGARARQPCLLPAVVGAMNALMNQALRDPAFEARRDLYRRMGGASLDSLAAAGASETEPFTVGQPFQCVVAAKPAVSEASGGGQGSTVPQLMNMSVVEAVFGAEPVDGRNYRITLRTLFGERPSREYARGLDPQAAAAPPRPAPTPPKAALAGPMAESDEAVDQGFLAWSRQWMRDRYVPGSAKTRQFDCDARQCRATGMFTFVRAGSGELTIPFAANLVRSSPGELTVTRLCYDDTSTGIGECRNMP